MVDQRRLRSGFLTSENNQRPDISCYCPFTLLKWLYCTNDVDILEYRCFLEHSYGSFYIKLRGVNTMLDSPTERIITLRITSERITSERINTEHITS
jgi:hypothetical protein